MPAARAASVLEGLGPLLDERLIRVDHEGGETRYGMLGTLRECALHAWQRSHEAQAIRARHAAYFLALAEQNAAEWPLPVAGRRA